MIQSKSDLPWCSRRDHVQANVLTTASRTPAPPTAQMEARGAKERRPHSQSRHRVSSWRTLIRDRIGQPDPDSAVWVPCERPGRDLCEVGVERAGAALLSERCGRLTDHLTHSVLSKVPTRDRAFFYLRTHFFLTSQHGRWEGEFGLAAAKPRSHTRTCRRGRSVPLLGTEVFFKTHSI